MTYLRDVSKGNVSFMLEMLQIFINRTPETIALLESAIIDSDWEHVGFWSHKLKSTYAYMGMEEMRLELLVLEKNAKNRINLDLIPGEFYHLKIRTLEIIKEIEAYQQQLSL